jgi:hypothetical protein
MNNFKKIIVNIMLTGSMMVLVNSAYADNQPFPGQPATCTIQGVQIAGSDDFYIWGTGFKGTQEKSWLHVTDAGLPTKFRSKADWIDIDRDGDWAAKLDYRDILSIFTGTLGNIRVQQWGSHHKLLAQCDSGLQLITFSPFGASASSAPLYPGPTDLSNAIGGTLGPDVSGGQFGTGQ